MTPNFNMLFNAYRSAAKKRGFTFTLSKEEVNRITSSHCSYCGKPPIQIKSRPPGEPYLYNGIDRVDNDRGYEPDNVVPACGTCNSMKWKFPLEKFLAQCFRVVFHTVREMLTPPVHGADLAA